MMDCKKSLTEASGDLEKAIDILRKTGIAKARSAGDMMSPANGKTQISTKEGGLFEMSKNDDILAAPGLAGAMAGGGATNVTNVDNSGLERQNKEIKGEMSQLRKDMAS